MRKKKKLVFLLFLSLHVQLCSLVGFKCPSHILSQKSLYLSPQILYTLCKCPLQTDHHVVMLWNYGYCLYSSHTLYLFRHKSMCVCYVYGVWCVSVVLCHSASGKLNQFNKLTKKN